MSLRSGGIDGVAIPEPQSWTLVVATWLFSPAICCRLCVNFLTGGKVMIGRMVSHYIILEQIGAGGMGVVYRAHDQKLKRDVALKVLPPRTLDDDGARSRFQREALALSQLNHPNICTIYEIGEADNQTYIVMEYLDGRPPDKLIPSGGLAIETSIQYGMQIADALAHAHGQKLLHRDLKSSNVMVTKQGRVKLLDFGLAKRMQSGPSEETLTQEESLTQEGTVMGTVAYMAPEVLRRG
jgi:serine/threonine protein kinase